MASAFQFDLVSPERKLASLEATEVQIPGSDGDLTALAGHAPFMTTLRPGYLSVSNASGVSEYLVTGGFVEISEGGTTVLAERAILKEDVNEALLNELIENAEAAIENAPNIDEAAKRAADFKALSA